jgi:tetratricopeptide (TPR) repeat protein
VKTSPVQTLVVGLARCSAGVAVVLSLAYGVAAQTPAPPVLPADPAETRIEFPKGFFAKPDELEAWTQVLQERFIRARELAEAILRKDSSSYVARLVLGLVQHYAEANFPKALYQLNLALQGFEKRHGIPSKTGSVWRWHEVLLKELAWVHSDLEHYPEQLAYFDRHNALYSPTLIAERAWPLMKLGRYGEARLAANLGLVTGEPEQLKLALNALCAIEFESGNDQASYRACKDAVDDASLTEESPSAVDLTNFAEAARGLFKLDEAEEIGLKATAAAVSWYGNPWLELSELYLREGRLEEALYALKKIPEYRARRPPHARDSDRNETRRAIAAFLLLVARPREALQITSVALVAPDRRAHNSRDPLQDKLVIALLDRRARFIAAEQLMERASAGRWYVWPWAFVQASYLRFQAWRQGAEAKRLVSDEQRLVGLFKIGSARGAVLSPWLAGELVELLGAGVASEAIARARASDKRPGSGAYYDAFSAEAAAHRGDYAATLQLSYRALKFLPSRELLLRARLQALASHAAWKSGQNELAFGYYDAALQADRGIYRRLDLPLPVRISVGGDAVAERVASLLSASPRLSVSRQGLELRIEADRTSGRACLLGARGEVLGCGQSKAETAESGDALASRVAADFHDKLFTPPVDISRADINSLDGTNLSSRDTLRTIYGPP